MGKNSNIYWTDHTWNPVSGCSKVSPGCRLCYAEVVAERYRGTPAFPKGFDITLRPHKLREPDKWKEPAMIFVNSMSDLFHRDIPETYLCDIWQTMLDVDRHVYQVLTKRPHRMAHLIEKLGLPTPEHIWLGVSAENQVFADNRIPPLLAIGGDSLKWVSAEPLLGPLNLEAYLPTEQTTKFINENGHIRYRLADKPNHALEWIVSGGESGSGRRPADPDWFRGIRDQCVAFGVPFLHKQGNHLRPGRYRELDGETWDQLPGIDHPAVHAARKRYEAAKTTGQAMLI